jgi:hypothetical protein
LTLTISPTTLGLLAPLATLALRPTVAALRATAIGAILATTAALPTLALATRFRATGAIAAEALTHLLHALLHALAHLRTALATSFRATGAIATEAFAHLLHALANLCACFASTCGRRWALAALTLPFVVTLAAAAASLLRVQRDSQEEDREGR